MRTLSKDEKLQVYKEILKVFENISYKDFISHKFSSLGICTYIQTVTFEKFGIYASTIDLYEAEFSEFFKYKKGPEYWAFPFWWPISWVGILIRRRVLRTIIKNLKK